MAKLSQETFLSCTGLEGTEEERIQFTNLRMLMGHGSSSGFFYFFIFFYFFWFWDVLTVTGQAMPIDLIRHTFFDCLRTIPDDTPNECIVMLLA